MEIEEGYYDCKVERRDDCDHGPCTAYICEGFTVYLYDDHSKMISIHEE
jgi:hypothetical protein